MPTGLHGGFQTDENHHRKGYGELVMRYVSKKVAESLGHDMYASILEKNDPSRKLFEKNGYRLIDEVHWIMTNIYWTPEDD